MAPTPQQQTVDAKADQTVFVVDDDPQVRESLRLLMRATGLAVETFASAQEFLAGDARRRPGCLVLDFQMPGMTGLDLLERLEAERVRIPTIMLTGHGDEQTKQRALEIGVLQFLHKPYDTPELIATVRRALNNGH